MKKILLSIITVLSFVMLFSTLSAVEVSTDTIAAGSYLIGTHLFDREGSSSYDGTLTVRHIMFASKTIPGNTIEDMQILYNRARDGVWVDAITNEEVEMPAKVNVEYRNLEKMLVAPTLLSSMGGLGYSYISIINDGAYASEDMWNAIDGFELYEKDGEELTLVDEYEPTDSAKVTANAGESKTYVARVFVYFNENQKVYSDYSNEYTITNTSDVAFGDIDNDGIVDEEDAYLLEDYLMGNETLDGQGLKNADMNGDYVVNEDDYPILIQYLVDGNTLPFYETKENITKIEYYMLDELGANEYLISVPEGVEIEWNGEYQFAENSVIYDIELFELPSEFNEWERFEGWFLDEEGTIEFEETQTLTGITKLYAKFDTEFIMVYNGNGATGGTMENSVFTIGETAKLAKNLYTRDGYNFVAWSNDAEDFSELANDEEEFEIPLWFLTEAKEPFILYAVWEKEVVYGDINGDNEINGSDATKILRHIMELEELTEEQLMVADVNLDEEIDYVDYKIVLKKAVNLIEALPYDSGEKYKISYDVDSGECEWEIEFLQTEYAQVSLPMALPTLVKAGYVFTGWTGSNGDVPQKAVIIGEGTTGDLEYTANWILLGDVTGDSLVDIGDAVKVWRYVSGLETLTEEELIAADVNLDGDIDEIDRTIIQKYNANLIESLPYDSGEKYNITYNLNGGTTEQPLDNVYAEISLPTLLQPTKEGYVFIGWTGSNGETPQLEVTIEEGTTGNLSYTANWELAE